MDTILWPIMWLISWVLYGIHWVLTKLGMASGAGVAWIIAILGLTVVVRLIVLPLYNKQIRASRESQILQPEIQKIQAKYKGKKDPQSQQRMGEEMRALYKDAGTSPFASCLPILVQMPILFALFRVLYAFPPIAAQSGDYKNGGHLGPITQDVAQQFLESELFGAPLAASMSDPVGAPVWTVRIVAAVLILFLVVTMFYTTKQLTMKNMPESAMDPNNPMFKTQKYMMYGMPFIYLFTGIAFQIGVLVYWCAGNVWNIGQQTWFLRHNPTPGSTAHKARIERLRAKKERKGKLSAKEEAELVEAGQEKVAHINEDGDLVGKDGLTDEERARKQYERRQAERARSKPKKKKKKKKK